MIMPKSTDKDKSRKRPKSSSTDSKNQNGNDENQEHKKKKVQKKPRLSDSIEKSKQLSQKSRTPRTTRSTGKKNTAPRICGNGKPMPALAELELMYKDSEDEAVNNESPPASTPLLTTKPRPTTPTSPLKIPEDKLLSPTALKKIASKVLARIDTILETDTPRPPVIPPKKRKKTEIPYIVGCKDRPQVPWAPAKNSFCVGDPDYGVEPNDEPEPEECCKCSKCCPKKRCKRSSKLNISKSIFNAKTDEIVASLQAPENNSRRDSSDSNRTVDYDYMNTMYAPRPFSPLPSTSKDNETILKNEQLFNESLNCEQIYNLPLNNSPLNTTSNDSQNDLEIIETPVETITVNDSITEIKPEVKTETNIIIDDDDLCMIWPDNNLANSPTNTNDDSCVIVESDVPNSATKKDTTDVIETIELKDEYYGSLDLTQTYDTDVCEVIDLDIDDVLAESNAILEKYKSKNITEVTTVVEPVCSNRTRAHSSTREEISSAIVPNLSTPAMNTNENIPTTSAALPCQPSTSGSSHNNPTHISTIPDVVQNFFSRHSVDSSQTVDLTAAAHIPATASLPPSPSLTDTVMSLIRCIFTRESGNRETASRQVVPDQVTPNSSIQTNSVSVEPNRNVMNDHNYNVNTSHNNNIDYMQYLRRIPSNRPANNRTRKPRKSNPIPAAPPVVTTPSTVVESNNNNTSTRNLGECPICMENLSKSAIASTLCGHIFCVDCIKAAIRTNGKRCPNCRKALKGVGYHQIYI